MTTLGPLLAFLGGVACVGNAPFVDVTPDGLRSLAIKPCLVVRDFDGDGRPDLLTLESTGDGNHPWRPVVASNLGDFKFGTPSPLPVAAGDYWSCSATDLDGDGVDEFIFVGMDHEGTGDKSLRTAIRWDGNTPSEMVDPLPVLGQRANNFCAFDADLDGHNELFISYSAGVDVSECTRTPDDFTCALATPPSLGKPRLHQLDASAGFPTLLELNAEYDLALHVLDWEGDGDPDIYRAVDFGISQLLLNDGAGTFTNVLAELGAAKYAHNMGAAFADFDGDGRLDIYTTDIGTASLWMQQADGHLVDEAAARGVAAATTLDLSWSPISADFDQDGDADIFAVNSALAKDDAELTLMSRGADPAPRMNIGRQGDRYLRNDGKGHFEGVVIPAPERVGLLGQSVAATGDFDGDGLLDLAVASYGYDYGQLRVLRNAGPRGAPGWLGVRPRRSVPVGTRLVVTNAGKTVYDERFVANGRASNEPLVLVGLPDASAGASLEWRVPGRDVVQSGPHASGQVVDVGE